MRARRRKTTILDWGINAALVLTAISALALFSQIAGHPDLPAGESLQAALKAPD